MSTQSTTPVRIGLLQFAPTHSRPDISAAKAQSLLSSISPGSIDLLVAPEMCLTGYVFRDLDHVKGLCEGKNDGATIRLAKEASSRMGCYSLMGFPEVQTQRANERPMQTSEYFDARPKAEQTATSTQDDHEHYYNSAILTNPSGTALHTFRKHFLFNDDERWCESGSGFQYIDIPLSFGSSSTIRMAVGLCMDINPYQFKTDFEHYEFASWCVDHEVNLVVIPMAWLCSTDAGQGEAEEPHLDVVNYWAARFAPLIERGREGSKVVLVACNRTGKEGESTFAGSSSVISFEKGKRPELLACMGRREEGLLTEAVEVSCNSSSRNT